jgi:hypothetical protein
MPTEWESFSKEAVLGLPAGPAADTPDPIAWLVGIDADPAPSVDHILDVANLAADHPQGIALVQDLSFTERDSASIQYMRNYLFPVDQLIQDASDAQIVAYDDQLSRDTFRGVHLVYQFRASALGEPPQEGSSDPATDGSSELQRALLGGQGVEVLTPDFVQVSQTVFIDAQSSRIYFFAMYCSATCYARNRADIESAVDSWTVLT